MPGKPLRGFRAFGAKGKDDAPEKENFCDHTLQISLKCISENFLQLFLAVIAYSCKLAPYSKLFAIHFFCTNQ